MPRRRSGVRRRWAVGALIGLLFAAVGTAPQTRAAQAASVPVVGVVDFYATEPVEGALGVVPERFAADDLAAALGRAANGQISIVPRADVSKAEAALRWRENDVLSFARLGVLAQHLGADRLVVGWITLFSFGPMNDGEAPGGGYLGTVNLVIQVFDAAQGRLVWQTTGTALGQGIILGLVMQEVLHQAIAPTVAPTLAALLASGT
jgi:hypothetical protein